MQSLLRCPFGIRSSGTFRWLSPDFISLVWAYSWAKVILTVFARIRDSKTRDLLLERGILESIRRSQNSAQVQILVNNVTQVFTAPGGAFAFVAPGDSVIFAYTHQTREIILGATIDVSTPGRVAFVRGWIRAGMANMELDVGYVQDVEKGERDVSETASVSWQSIVIADTAARDSVNQRKYQYDGGRLFNIHVGDLLVTLSTGRYGQILDLRNESRPTMRQPGTSARILRQEAILRSSLRDQRFEKRAKENLRNVIDTLRSLNVDAVALELDPFELEPDETWLELTNCPIRYIETVPDPYEGTVDTTVYVPDPRITSDFLAVWVAPVWVRTFPLFGRIKAIRWKDTSGYPRGRKGESLTRFMIDHLNHDTTVANTILSARDTLPEPGWIENDAKHSCWILVGWDRPRELTRPVWDCYLAMAEALLAMPVPTEV